MHGIIDIVKELDDPESELCKFAKEGAELSAEFAIHDPKFSGLIIDALIAFKRAGEYVKLTYGEAVRQAEEKRKAENLAAAHAKKQHSDNEYP